MTKFCNVHRWLFIIHLLVYFLERKWDVFDMLQAYEALVENQMHDNKNGMVIMFLVILSSFINTQWDGNTIN